MQSRTRLQNPLVIGCLFLLTPLTGKADALITFEGLTNNSPIGNFYNGGAGGNLGISFNNRFVALIDSDAGGTGIFGGEPSAPTVATITPSSTSSAVINIAVGFNTSFSLFYSGPGNTVVLFDGVDAHGSQLSLTQLPATASTNEFRNITVDFSGTARSVLFGFVGFGARQTFVDNVQFGPAVPEPETLLLAVTGLAFIWRRAAGGH